LLPSIIALIVISIVDGKLLFSVYHCGSYRCELKEVLGKLV